MNGIQVGRGFVIMLMTAVAAGIGFYILREHWAHALGFVPYLLFLACPLMHLFMHRGHKNSQQTSPTQARKKEHSAGCH